MQHRRDFLKVFGLTSAVAVNVSTDKGAEFEKVTAEEPITPLTHEPFFNRRSAYDVVDGQLYSSLEIDGGEELINGYSSQFFSYGLLGPSGSSMLGGRWANLNDTNLSNAFRLDVPEMFAIKRIGLVFSPSCDPKDRSALVDSFAISLWLGQKCYFRMSTANLFSVGKPSIKETNRINPEFPVKYMHGLELPVVIETMLHFYVQLEGGSYFRPEHRMKMWAVLEGSHARGVQ